MSQPFSKWKWFFGGAGALVVLAGCVAVVIFLVSVVVHLVVPGTPSDRDGQGKYSYSVISPDQRYVAKVYTIGAASSFDSPSWRVSITSIQGNKFLDDSVAWVYPDILSRVAWTGNDSIELSVISKDSTSDYPNKFFDIDILRPSTYVYFSDGKPTRSVPISILPTASAHN